MSEKNTAGLLRHHRKLTDGKGKCSVFKYRGGVPIGFCNKEAFGDYIDGKRHERGPRAGFRIDGKFSGDLPGLACNEHGGPKRLKTPTLKRGKSHDKT